jgi:hypothetical protein
MNNLRKKSVGQTTAWQGLKPAIAFATDIGTTKVVPC